jgi:hypothetical protein
MMGLVPFLWYHPGHWIFGQDVDYPSNPIQVFFTRLYSWNNVFLGGVDLSQAIPTTPIFMGLQAALNFLGFSLGLEQILSYSVWFTAMGLAFYYFLLSFFGTDDELHSVIRIAGVVFYMFNFYQLFIWTSFYVGQGFEAILIPAFMGVLIRALREGRVTARTAVTTFLICIITSPVGEHPPSYVASFFVFVAFFVSFTLTNVGKDYRRLLNYLRVFGGLTLLFIVANMFWLLASANYIVSSSYLNSGYAKQVFTVSELLGYTSSTTSLFNVLRLQGNIDWFAGWGGQPYHPWFSQYLTNPLLVFASVCLPILVAFATLASPRNKYVQFFAALVLATLFLSTGIHQPGTVVYAWLVTNIPGFWILRAPWADFAGITIIGYSVLAAVTCGAIFRNLSQSALFGRIPGTRKKILPLLAILLILASNIAYNYSFVSGQMIPSSEGDFGYHQHYNVGYYVNIPSYIFQATDWFNNGPSNSKVALLPSSNANVYQWGRGAASDVTFDLFSKGVLSGQFGQGTAAPNSLQEEYGLVTVALNNGASENLSKVLGLMNVGYLLERNDFSYNFYGPSIASPQFIKHQLALQNGIKLERSFGSWDFYSNQLALPLVYPSTNLIVDNGTLRNDFVQDANLLTTSEMNYTALFFQTQQPDSSTLALSIAKSSIFSTSRITALPALDGGAQPFSWSNQSASTQIHARDYVGVHKVISTNGIGSNDMLIFPSPGDCPYVFPTSPDWSSFDSTLIFIQTGNAPISISSVSTNGAAASDIIGVWWQTGWMGMGTNPLSFPISIPANQKAIIQVNHLSESVQLELNNVTRVVKTPLDKTGPPLLRIARINPTELRVNVDQATAPFLLILSEPYQSQWKAYYGSGTWLSYPFHESIPDRYHIIVNGFANGWYVNRTGSFDITLYYVPQSLVYLGGTITVASGLALAMITMINWSRRRRTYHRVEV